MRTVPVCPPFVVAFQLKKARAIGVKAPFPGFVEPALAASIESAVRRSLDP
jgi:hypothetical protein